MVVSTNGKVSSDDAATAAEHTRTPTVLTDLQRTRVFDALGWSFSVASDEIRVVEYVEHLFGSLPASSGQREHAYVVERGDDASGDVARLVLDGTVAGKRGRHGQVGDCARARRQPTPRSMRRAC